MKLLSTRDGKEFTGELTTEHPASIPGPLAIRRLDDGTFIALRDCIGVPGAPGSTLNYQLLEVSKEEKERLDKEGIIIAESTDDLINWLQNWDGPKPGEKKKHQD